MEKAKQRAKDYFIDNNGSVSVKVLARKAKVPQGTIRKWMKEENWREPIEEDPGDLVSLSDSTKEVLKSGAEQYGLSEQEELFCYHYLKTFNATTSAIRAGYSPSYAHNKAYRLLKQDKIKDFIHFLKQVRNEELFLEPIRVIHEYMRIAFADMTDFVRFGPGGVEAKPSNTVDGQLITKIKQGREGLSLELADKMKALEKLEEYLGVMPVDWRQVIAEKKLDLEKEKVEGDTEAIAKLDLLLEGISNEAKR